MLRINEKLKLNLRDRERFLSFDLVKALFGAFCFHVLLFFLFRITLYPNFESLQPLMPIHVEVDLKSSQSALFPSVKVKAFTMKPPESPHYYDMLEEISHRSFRNDCFSLKQKAVLETILPELKKENYFPLPDVCDDAIW